MGRQLPSQVKGRVLSCHDSPLHTPVPHQQGSGDRPPEFWVIWVPHLALPVAWPLVSQACPPNASPSGWGGGWGRAWGVLPTREGFSKPLVKRHIRDRTPNSQVPTAQEHQGTRARDRGSGLGGLTLRVKSQLWALGVSGALPRWVSSPVKRG